MLSELSVELTRQIWETSAINKIEILTEVDNGESTTGKKRNILLDRATGEYVAFIDDDDWVPRYYIRETIKAIHQKPDVIGFAGKITTDGGNELKWAISKDFPYVSIKDESGMDAFYLRFNNHLSPIKRSIATQICFKDVVIGEDSDYAHRLKESGLIKTEVFINKEMYHYRYVSNK
jgi:glycosyltransferase involved in cell wall biosynthesis